jgi:hypothetical protein
MDKPEAMAQHEAVAGQSVEAAVPLQPPRTPGTYGLLLVYVAVVAVEGLVGWSFDRIGSSLLVPAGLEGIVGLAAVALVVTVGRRIPTSRLTGAVVGLVAVTVLGWVWVTGIVLPLRVALNEPELMAAVRCYQAGASGCGPLHNWTAPLVGTIAAPSNAWSVPGEVVLGHASPETSQQVQETGFGYFYEPNPALALSGPGCVRHLYGPWYEFGAFTGNCPWGFSLSGDNALAVSDGRSFSVRVHLQVPELPSPETPDRGASHQTST